MRNEGSMTPAERNREIIRTGTVGIAANLMLATFKAFVGALSGSIAITLDAVNNLSDALSSVITIVAAKLSAKPADREHPLGYGRVEYLSAMLISGIVLFAGATSLIESAKKVMEPTDASYSPVALLIVAVAIAAKLLLGTYTGERGGRRSRTHSSPLARTRCSMPSCPSRHSSARASRFCGASISMAGLARSSPW